MPLLIHILITLAAAAGLYWLFRRMTVPSQLANSLGPHAILLRRGEVPAAELDDPSRPRWGIVEFLLAGFGWMFLTAYVAGQLPESATAARYLVSGAASLLCVVGATFLIQLGQQRSPMSTWFPAGTGRTVLAWLLPLSLLTILGVMLGLAPISQIVVEAMQLDTARQPAVDALAQSRDTLLWTAVILSAGIAAPIWEEILFRGILYIGVRRFIGPLPAAIGTGLLFGLIHANAVGFVPLAILGVVLAISYERSRNLALPILIHAAFNATTLISLALSRSTLGG